MPLYLYKRPNGIWHIRGTVQNERFDHSSKTRSRIEAEQIKAKWEADAFRKSVYGERAVGNFADAVTGYILAGGDGTFLDPLIVAFGSKKLSDVTQAGIDKLAAKRLVKPSTRVREIYTPLLAVLNFAFQQGLCDHPRIRKPEIKAPRTGYLTPEQAEAWIEALPPHLSRLVTFYLATGCRASEALGLEWKDVSTGLERVVFWDTKSGHARGVDLQPRARKALGERGKGPIFLNSRGEPWHSYDAINLMLRRKREKDGSLTPAHCHLFRHTWATWAYACTRDLTFVQQQGGWRSLTMVGRYTHVGSADLATAVLDRGWGFSGREIPSLRPRRRKT